MKIKNSCSWQSTKKCNNFCNHWNPASDLTALWKTVMDLFYKGEIVRCQEAVWSFMRSECRDWYKRQQTNMHSEALKWSSKNSSQTQLKSSKLWAQGEKLGTKFYIDSLFVIEQMMTLVSFGFPNISQTLLLYWALTY